MYSDNFTYSVSTQQIYTVVVEIRDATPGPDVRWTYFQQPLLIEDALGRKFPVPSEYHFDLLETVIKHKFQTGPGAKHVNAGNYELCKMHKWSDVITPKSRLLPGMAITMAIIMTVPTIYMDRKERCPMPHCQSSAASPCPGGGGFVW